MKCYYFFVAILLSMCSCDPARVLILEASKKDKSFVTIYTNENFGQTFKSDATAKKVEHKTPGKGNEDELIFFGLGTWGSDESISTLSENTDSIVFDQGGKTLALKEKQEIFSYLKKHRKGLLKSRIIIKAE